MPSGGEACSADLPAALHLLPDSLSLPHGPLAKRRRPHSAGRVRCRPRGPSHPLLLSRCTIAVNGRRVPLGLMDPHKMHPRRPRVIIPEPRLSWKPWASLVSSCRQQPEHAGTCGDEDLVNHQPPCQICSHIMSDGCNQFQTHETHD